MVIGSASCELIDKVRSGCHHQDGVKTVNTATVFRLHPCHIISKATPFEDVGNDELLPVLPDSLD